MASLPATYAGRTALGLGKRLGGTPAEAITAQMSARTAEQMFKVLGELKGGAMKLGQALSIFEAALPEEFAAPYRAMLTKLQDSAPAMPTSAIHKILTEEFGEDWRNRFIEFSDQPAAAASIGQVHKATWHDGRVVAVKVQYPGADKALVADLNQMIRMGKLFAGWIPGLDLGPLLEELRERAIEELDYLLESQNQRAFAVAFEGDPDFHIPHVLAAAPHVLISEWIDGRPLSDNHFQWNPQPNEIALGCSMNASCSRVPHVRDCCTQTRIQEISESQLTTSYAYLTLEPSRGSLRDYQLPWEPS